MAVMNSHSALVLRQRSLVMTGKEKASCTWGLSLSNNGKHLELCYHILAPPGWGKGRMHSLDFWNHSSHLRVLVVQVVLVVLVVLVVTERDQGIAGPWPLDICTLLAMNCHNLIQNWGIFHMHFWGCHGYTSCPLLEGVVQVAMEQEQGIAALVLVVLGQGVTNSCICCCSTGTLWGRSPARNRTCDLQLRCHEQRRSSNDSNQRHLSNPLAPSTYIYTGFGLLQWRCRTAANLLGQDQ